MGEDDTPTRQKFQYTVEEMDDDEDEEVEIRLDADAASSCYQVRLPESDNESYREQELTFQHEATADDEEFEEDDEAVWCQVVDHRRNNKSTSSNTVQNGEKNEVGTSGFSFEREEI